jgi:hypothetical protein
MIIDHVECSQCRFAGSDEDHSLPPGYSLGRCPQCGARLECDNREAFVSQLMVVNALSGVKTKYVHHVHWTN